MYKHFIKFMMTLSLVVTFGMTSHGAKAMDDNNLVLTKNVNGVNVFDVSKMGDMSGFEPGMEIDPDGDVIKIAVNGPYSGPAAFIGDSYYAAVAWVAYDINQRGGLFVDGKRKKIKVIKANNQAKPDVIKKVVERMILQEKVDILWGTNGTNLAKIVNQLADRYKVIAQNTIALSDELQEGNAFSRYAFMTCPTTGQIGRGMAYYYGKVRKKEKKFYILGQDYSFGHAMSEGFKEGLKDFYPEAEVVGEDYHKLFLTDYAPYISKIKNSGAEVLFTGDWPPDSTALLKQSRNLGLNIPFAHFFIDDPVLLKEVGYEGVLGNVQISMYGTDGPIFKGEDQIKYYKTWNDLWKNKWKEPYNTALYKWPFGGPGSQIEQTYWMFSVMERAGSTNADKMIKVWEGDKYQFLNGKKMEMRACDHKTIQDLHVWEYVKPEGQKALFNIPPYQAFEDTPGAGLNYKIPREAIVPYMDKSLDRCK